MRACLGIFFAFAWPWAPAQCEFFFTKSFVGFVTRKRVFRALDWLASTLGDKIMAEKPSFWQKLEFSKKETLATSLQIWPLVVVSQIELESYSNPLKTREVFSIRWKKKLSEFFGLFGPWPHDWRMFCEYSYDVICGSNSRILWLKGLLDPGVEYEFLEPLIDLLAFLVQNLGQKEPFAHIFNVSPTWGSPLE